MITCPLCGATNPPYTTFCGRCGRNMVEARPSLADRLLRRVRQARGQGGVQDPRPGAVGLRLAAPARRFDAGLCDTAVVLLAAVLVDSAIHDFHIVRDYPLLLMLLAITAVYLPFCWAVAGKTIGMALHSTQVVRADGRRITPVQAVVRWAGWVVATAALGLGLVWAWWDARRQNWADKLSGTVVVHTGGDRRPTLSLFTILGILGILAWGFTHNPRGANGSAHSADFWQPIVHYTLPSKDTAPSAIAAGPDGSMWFTERTGNRIGHITHTGRVTQFAIPTASSSPLGITAGPDGNIWFTEAKGNKIGRITRAGRIAEYPLPTTNAFPLDIATGHDGNLWFVEARAGQIGRITPRGAIKEFALRQNLVPTGMTAGPDGNMWFVEDDQRHCCIARITRTGHIDEFAIPTLKSGPAMIAAGPHKTLWFTEYDANKIGRITLQGHVSEFSLPEAKSNPYSIVAGPNGNMWFTELAWNTIGWIMPNGTIVEVVIPGQNSSTDQIAFSADGYLWVTLDQADMIARVARTAPPYIPSLPVH